MQKDIAGLIRRDAVHRSIYTDPEIFALEMERIFDRTWVYLAHDCEISQEGDYKTGYLGRHPIIVSRLSDGTVTALLNRCRHRGATVCQHEVGNSRFFRCAYHAWTYANDGKLIGVPIPSGYGPSFKREDHGLAKVPRVASYRGFIFGSMAEDGPSLEQHLGGAKKLLDDYCAVSPTGKIEVFRGYQKCAYNGNWKYQIENGVDPYHVGALHRSAVTPEAMNIYKEGKGRVIDMDGHGVTDHTDWGPMPVDAGLTGGFNLVLFPNLVLLRSQIRIIRPIAVDRTEIYTNVVRLQGVPDEVNLRRMRDQEFEFGAAGTFYTDDMEIFERSQRGLQSSAVDWVVFARGLDREQRYGGYLASEMSDETQHRGMYRRWQELMMEQPAMAAAE
jgi:nitrite reductase/ring-hydroxylating ferredoxin subunit